MRSLSTRMIGLLLAATAVTPIAAQAQTAGQNEPRDHEGRGGRGAWQGGEPREQMPQRQEQNRPQAQAQAPAASPAQPQPQAPQQVTRQQAEQRGERDNRQFNRQPGQPPQQAGQQIGQQPGRDAAIAANRDNRRDDNRDDRRNWQNRRDDARFQNDSRFQNRDDRRDNRGNWNNGRPDAPRAWSRDWRGDRRYGWQDYRNSNRAIFRAPAYIAPRGYAYRRWSPGFRIDPWFYSPGYWINNPWDYRLPPAYGDYRWVRYYDDVYLIDIRTGFVEDVIYGFFWR